MESADKNMEMAKLLAARIAAAGGRAYFVGGFVRDRLRGAPNKDIDIEAHGIGVNTLEAILGECGEPLRMGASFGIFGLRHYELDVAMPRKEKCVGGGHRDFEVTVDPFIGTRGAAIRRDFTINAMMQDILTGEIVDHFGGVSDLRAGILRHVNDATFAEDPLRVLRAAQFAARFGFSVAPETAALCARIDLSALSRERVDGELSKALLKAERPSVFFSFLRRCGQLDVWFPEAAALIGVPQDPAYHAEGDVWTHTLAVLDEAAALRDRARDPRAFMLSALVHDFGKAMCTEETEGRIHAYGHETAGLAPAEAFLSRLTDEKKLRRRVLNMTELHMRPVLLANVRASVKKTNMMFDAAAESEDLILLGLADDRGRIAAVPREDPEAFLYERLRIYRETAAGPGVTGEDLIRAGLRPGRDFSSLLAYAHRLRLSGLDRESALKGTLAEARRLRGKTDAPKRKNE